MRIHVTRNTPYGDRFKLYKFEVKPQESINLSNYLGFSLRQENNSYWIDQLKFDGKAKKQGIDFDDELTSIELGNPNHLHKNWGYVFRPLTFDFYSVLAKEKVFVRKPVSDRSKLYPA